MNKFAFNFKLAQFFGDLFAYNQKAKKAPNEKKKMEF